MIKAEFGEPKDLVSNYILEQEADDLRRAIKYSGYIKTFSVFAVFILFVILVSNEYTLYKHMQEERASYIDREVIIIEEGEETIIEDKDDIINDTVIEDENGITIKSSPKIEEITGEEKDIEGEEK